MMNSGLFINKIELKRNLINDFNKYPFNIDNIKKFQIKEQKSDENIVQDDLLSDEPKKEELSENKENNENTVETSKEENIEEYIFLNIYRNKDSKIGDEYQKLVLKLQEDLKNSNDKLIKTWVNNYMAFANHYKNELDKDKLIKYMYELFKNSKIVKNIR